MSYQPTGSDFRPAVKEEGANTIVRPSLSYWEDAWRRLKKNGRAIASLYIVIGLLIFTLIGPFIWTVNPSSQDLEQISESPTWTTRTALVVDEYERWDGVFSNADEALKPAHKLGALTGLKVVGEPNTESVKLTWDPVPGAKYYNVYRHEYEPHHRYDLGLPIGETTKVGEVSYNDKLNLAELDYYYSVVAMDGRDEALEHQSIIVSPQMALRFGEAKYRGLLPEEATLESSKGTVIDLQWHPLGTDYLGRDMLARLMAGAKTSLFIGVFAPLLYVFIGSIYGGFAGYKGGRIDNVMMRFSDFVIALPFLLFMILFKVILGIGPGESGVVPMLIAMVILSWPAAARLVRGQVLQIREEPFIQAAQLMGANSRYLLTRHLLPNVLGVVLVSLTFAVPSAIFTEAFLSFIGLGVAPPTPSWGSMSNDGMKSLQSYPHELLLPAFFISITVLAFNLLGDGLRDALDARMRGKS